MIIKIGNNAKLKKSIIGNNNKIENGENILITVIVTIITGVIVGGILFYFGWN